MTAKEFERELTVFQQESEAATQFFYCSQGLRLSALANGDSLRALNEHKPFWVTALAALQHATLAALGRIFDPEPANHSVGRLMALMFKCRPLFTRTALAERKKHVLQEPHLTAYLDEAFYPEKADLGKISTEVRGWRLYYEQVYRGLRHRVVAHRDAGDVEDIDRLWRETDLRELEKLLVNLTHLNQTLFDLYYNGRKPAPSTQRTSALEMLAQPQEFAGRAPLAERSAVSASKVIGELAERLAAVPMTREERPIDRQRMFARAHLELELALQNRQPK